MKLFLKILIAVPLIAFAAPTIDPRLLQNEDHLKLVINNRVLANINGKPITVVDIMKRMDILFLKQFPEYTNSVKARHQFYLVNWKRTLDELIEKELILADSKEVKMEISAADVRQDMEDLFGPNIIVNLDKIGLSFDEALKIVEGDIALRRMMFLRVTSKAIGNVTPQATRAIYDEFVKENTKDPSYTYRFVTIRSNENGEAIAKQVHENLNNKVDFAEAVKGLPDVTLSEVYTHTQKEIAPQNLEVISKMQAGAISPPIVQKSRASSSNVYRIFHLEKFNPGGAPPYFQVENKLKEHLMEKFMSEEHETYVNRLRKHFAIKEADIKANIPDDFTPFSLK
jgi:hypothetical protein